MIEKEIFYEQTRLQARLFNQMRRRPNFDIEA